MTAKKNAGRHPTQLGKTIVAENVENYKAAPEGGRVKKGGCWPVRQNGCVVGTPFLNVFSDFFALPGQTDEKHDTG